jgi:SRSO17 transposase
MRDAGEKWERELERWLTPYLDGFEHKVRRRWAPVYLRGLLLPGERKSIEPIVERVAPDEKEQIHHFVATSTWDTAPIEVVHAERCNELVGGPDAHLIIDDTALPKKGVHSVGVAHQYCGALGKQANCQSLVSLTLARDDVPIPIALRLYLPEAWASDLERREKARVPDDISFRPKWRIALDEIDRLLEHRVQFGDVLADAGYGSCGEFRAELTKRKLLWTVGVLSTQTGYPASVRLRPPTPKTPSARTPKRGIPTDKSRSVAKLIEELGPDAIRRVTWRKGTKGPLSGRFAMLRVRPADGPRTHPNNYHLPGDEVWLIAEFRTDETKYYLSNLPASASFKSIVSAIKARWSCEQMHQQMKEELGLDHFEGRSWHGLHHHALLGMIAFTFLQHIRLRAKHG